MSKYDDIIKLPYRKSVKYRHMSIENRAAQFASFAALVGHDAAIKETARLTDARPELDEGVREKIDAVLQEIRAKTDERPQVSLVCFVKDERKSGGKLEERTGRVKRLDMDAVVFENGERVEFEDITEIELSPDHSSSEQSEPM